MGVMSGTLTCPRCGMETPWPNRCDCKSATPIADAAIARFRDRMGNTEGTADEVGWLIERSWGGRAHWWIGNAFLPDAGQAVRFARRDDADRVILEQGLEGATATEHMWINSMPPENGSAK